MRARGVGSLMGLLVSGGLSVAAMHSCQSTPTSSPVAPSNVAKNAVAGICANQRAVAAAGSGDDSVSPVTMPPDLAQQLRQIDRAAGAVVDHAVTCPTETITP